jgi:hypothetical protein
MADDYLSIDNITTQRVIDFSNRKKRIVTCCDVQGCGCCDGCHFGRESQRNMKDIVDAQGVLIARLCCLIAREIR